MFKSICSVLLLLLLTLTGISANAKEKQVIMTIGGDKIYSDEFLRMYRKNNLSLPDSLQKTPQQYLQLFIDFKLKVRAAEALGMDTLSSFKSELARYREESAAPYLTDSTIDEQLIRTMYNRMITEVKASHILIRIPPNASPADTMKAWKQINDLRQRAVNGDDFAKLALNYSEDPSARTNKGELGYFSGFMMVYPFEKAAYNIPVGHISPIVRTHFGYHLIKVEDKRPSPGEMHAAHIMFFVRPGSSPEVDAQIHAKADSIYQMLQNGADFAQLAKKYSDDKKSGANGGALPWFRAGRMIPEIAEAAFALKKDGDYSKPIRSQYGWHIVKRLAIKPVPSFDELRPKIVENLKKSPERNQEAKAAFIRKLKSEYPFNENSATPEWLASLEGFSKDSLQTKVESTTNLFSINLKPVSSDKFLNFIKQKDHTHQPLTQTQIDNYYNRFKDQSFLNYEDSQLEKKYPEFRLLVKEYHDGLLLFNITDQKVWQKAVKDTTGLKEFYANHREKFRTERYFDGTVYLCPSQKTATEVDKMVEAGKDSTTIIEKFKDLKGFSRRSGKFKLGDNPAVDFYIFNDKDAATNAHSELAVLQGKQQPGGFKPLNEVRGTCLADYQDFLEKQWVKQLRQKYPVKIKHQVMNKILKHTAEK